MLGREVYRAFSELEDVEVTGTHRRSGASFDLLDAEDPASVRRMISGSSPDFIVNCAGVLASMVDVRDAGSIRRAVVVNSLLPLDLGLIGSELGARVLHVSTDGVFRADAGLCFEDSRDFDEDVYAVTKRLGEPVLENVLAIRCSIVGVDPSHGRGLVEWCRSQAAGKSIPGYVDQLWNGVTTRELARLLTKLADLPTFEKARSESHVHHVFHEPSITKFELVSAINGALDLGLRIDKVESGHPVNRSLGTRFSSLSELLPTRSSLKAAVADLI